MEIKSPFRRASVFWRNAPSFQQVAKGVTPCTCPACLLSPRYHKEQGIKHRHEEKTTGACWQSRNRGPVRRMHKTSGWLVADTPSVSSLSCCPPTTAGFSRGHTKKSHPFDEENNHGAAVEREAILLVHQYRRCACSSHGTVRRNRRVCSSVYVVVILQYGKKVGWRQGKTGRNRFVWRWQLRTGGNRVIFCATPSSRPHGRGPIDRPLDDRAFGLPPALSGIDRRLDGVQHDTCINFFYPCNVDPSDLIM